MSMARPWKVQDACVESASGNHRFQFATSKDATECAMLLTVLTVSLQAISVNHDEPYSADFAADVINDILRIEAKK